MLADKEQIADSFSQPIGQTLATYEGQEGDLHKGPPEAYSGLAIRFKGVKPGSENEECYIIHTLSTSRPRDVKRYARRRTRQEGSTSGNTRRTSGNWTPQRY